MLLAALVQAGLVANRVLPQSRPNHNNKIFMNPIQKILSELRWAFFSLAPKDISQVGVKYPFVS